MPSYPEKWRWEAHYLDGSVLPQYEEDGTQHLFNEIQQDRLDAVWMVAEHTTPVILNWVQGRKLILFSRNIIRYAMGSGGREQIRIYCIGYQDGKDKKMLAIMPDDAVIAIDDIDNLRVS